jgi:hypothetical protein
VIIPPWRKGGQGICAVIETSVRFLIMGRKTAWLLGTVRHYKKPSAREVTTAYGMDEVMP